MSDQNRLLLAAALMALVLFVSWQFMGNTAGTGTEDNRTVTEQQLPVTEQEDEEIPPETADTADAHMEEDSLSVDEVTTAPAVERNITVIIRDEGKNIVVATISTLSGSVNSWELSRYEDMPGSETDGRVNFDGSVWMPEEGGFQSSAPDTVVVEDGPRSIQLASPDGDRSLTYRFTPGFYGFSLEREGFDGQIALSSGILPVTETNVTPGSYFEAHWNAEKVKSRDTKDIEFNDQVGNVRWIATRSKYFGIILLPGSFERAYGYVYASNGESSPAVGIDDSSVLVYAGPLDYGRLRSLGSDTHLMVDFGWPIIRDIGRLLFWFSTSVLGFVGNWGVKIILLSIVLKLVLLPLTTKSFRSMAKLKQVQPRMKELQEKYRNDPKALQTAMQKLYREEGVNPLGGCLPMIMQMPVFFALYRVLANSVQLRGAGFMLWIKDLSTPELLIEFGSPMLGLQGIGLLAVLMGVSMFLQQKMTTTDQSQKSMMYILPVFMTYLFMRFPAGLTLYWFMNNLLTIGQQYMINSKLEAEKQS